MEKIHLFFIFILKFVYLFMIPKMLFYYTGEKDENIYKLGRKLFNKDITPVIYEIDNSDKLINKLFLDINYNEKGYYTLSNIKPDRIITIKYT